MKPNPHPAPVIPQVAGFVLGPFETNCYVVHIPAHPGCWVIDPGMEPREVIDYIAAARLKPTAILLTHAHVDHIAGIDEVRRAFPTTPVHLHEAEAQWLSDPLLNLSALGGISITAHGPDALLHDNDTLSLEGTAWSVLHTPGHSPGGVTFLHAPSSTAIVGDSLFAGSIGRTDFPGGDFDTLAASIRTRLYTLPDDTTIYPGHGPTSSIGAEKRTNPFVRPL